MYCLLFHFSRSCHYYLTYELITISQFTSLFMSCFFDWYNETTKTAVFWLICVGNVYIDPRKTPISDWLIKPRSWWTLLIFIRRLLVHLCIHPYPLASLISAVITPPISAPAAPVRLSIEKEWIGMNKRATRG